MTKETMLKEMIKIYGADHEIVKEFEALIKSTLMTEEQLKLILFLHQECPVED